MGIGIIGTTAQGSTTSEVDATQKALRVSLRSGEVTGAYRLATTNGATGIAAGAAADSEVFAFRNPSATKTAVVRKVSIDTWNGATAFTAGVLQVYLKKAKSFTVAPTAGTTVVLTTNNCKLTPGSETCACAAYIADDSVLTSGTETADATPIGFAVAAAVNTAHTVQFSDRVLYDHSTAATPFELTQDDGFIIYATVPATGVWWIRVTVEWEEYANATY